MLAHILRERFVEDKNIYVTQPYLPPLDEFLPYLEKIWNNKVLTNGGPFHVALEQSLCDYLGVNHISLFTNGTIALVTALQALQITGEVITTPYSFVATAHSLVWNGIKPVFADVCPQTLNLNPNKIEAHITEHTTAIMPVHCYGLPCDVEAIQHIADKHHLKIIYDAAHAFGVKYNDKSLLSFGNLSVLSFHATKVFNTFEGGAIICHDEATKIKIDRLKNFGFVDEVNIVASGINGKMSEINAAFGLLQLKHMNTVLKKRHDVVARYTHSLNNVRGIHLLVKPHNPDANYSYFPILINEHYPLSRDELYTKLKKYNIHTRRYFFPLISSFPMYCDLPSAHMDNLPIASKAANEVLCLPIYPDLSAEDQQKIINLILES